MCQFLKKIILKAFLSETINPEEVEESANLLKIQGDYNYFKQDYAKALELYQASLEFGNKSRSLGQKAYHDKKLIKDKEVSESIARCLAHLNRFTEAIEITNKFLNLVLISRFIYDNFDINYYA